MTAAHPLPAPATLGAQALGCACSVRAVPVALVGQLACPVHGLHECENGAGARDAGPHRFREAIP